MDKLTLHPSSQKLLEAYFRTPTHALGLTGPIGTGLGTLARTLGAELAGSDQLVSIIEPEKGLISIERVRSLYEQTRSVQQGKRVIVIDDADAMSRDAQNSLLKLLEEPARNVHFILTSHAPERLLQTIRSRTQIIAVRMLTDDSSRALLSHYSLDETRERQALFLATGKPAELTRLATDDEYFAARVAVVTDARLFLQGTPYDRLVIVKKYTDRISAHTFLSMCTRLLRFNLVKQRHYASADLMPVFETVMKRVDANGHVRTQLMYLVTKLP